MIWSSQPPVAVCAIPASARGSSIERRRRLGLLGLRVHDLWHTAATWRLRRVRVSRRFSRCRSTRRHDDVGRLLRALTDDIDAVVELLTRPFLWLVRTHCGLRRFYGFCGVLKRRGRRPSDRCKPTVGPVVLEPTTCGFDIPDSPSTRHAPRANSGGYDSPKERGVRLAVVLRLGLM